MAQPPKGTILDHFDDLDDPRVERTRRHNLVDIIAIAELLPGEVVAIDGKTARRSYAGAENKGAIHLVSAWATQNALTLGQVKTEEKSNEITAIPQLLEMLDLHGCIVTIDAMGCQREIAEKITEGGANYVLAVNTCWR